MITIRPEQPDDIAAVRAINEAAFAEPTEATIVDSLRARCHDAVSLVAEEDDRILGHIFFSPATVAGAREATRGMGLAPMAVLPPLMQQIAMVLPFRYMLGFPVEILTDQLDAAGLALGFTVQLAWVAVALTLSIVLWRRGLRLYEAVGG